jgi:murein L,D-transpeptidase YcbB/YkuD
MQVLNAGDGVVDPATINWDQMSARGFRYRFRQKPGPDNALGRIKFVLPNRYSVYLHDTPAKTLFSQARRCFSHGCVRLEKPLALADLLLHDEPGWSMERVDKTLDTEQNFHIRLTRPMPVYLVYWTAWVDNEGTIQFRSDVYGRDERLEAALQPSRS